MIEVVIDMESEGESISTHLKGEIVIPGQLIAEGRYRVGRWVYREGDKYYAYKLGLKDIRSVKGKPTVNVIPLAGKYDPMVGDLVIGVVVDMGPTTWLFDINGPNPAPLHITETPWKVDFGATGRYFKVADAAVLRVLYKDDTSHVQVTLKGPGLKKLHGGVITEIAPSKIPRVIGKNGSMIAMMKRLSRCQIIVGQNGRIWISGEVEQVKLVEEALRYIENHSHLSGLTAKVAELLGGDASDAVRAREEGDAPPRRGRRENVKFERRKE